MKSNIIADSINNIDFFLLLLFFVLKLCKFSTQKLLVLDILASIELFTKNRNRKWWNELRETISRSNTKISQGGVVARK
jgi:hypothetical protein